MSSACGAGALTVSAHFDELAERKRLPLSMARLLSLALLLGAVAGVKFDLPASHHPVQKCLWNYAMSDTLVVISVSAPQLAAGTNGAVGGERQRVDMEIVDGSSGRNVYQAKKGIKGETRMAITTHADADLGVCFKNTLDECPSRPPHVPRAHTSPAVPSHQAHLHVRSIDLDVDIGADAVDYNAIAKQESLSGLEVEMRKLEGVVKEIVDELNYLKRREARMRDTNGPSHLVSSCRPRLIPSRIYKRPGSILLLPHLWHAGIARHLADPASAVIFQEEYVRFSHSRGPADLLAEYLID